MRLLLAALRNLLDPDRSDSFLRLLKIIEGLVSKILSLLMVAVVLFSIYDLVILLIADFFLQPPEMLRSRLFDIFGLFLNVLIALEILENVTAYLRKHSVQLELVIVTALTAVARKIVIFDLEKKSPEHLISMSVAVFMLALSYIIIRRNLRPEE